MKWMLIEWITIDIKNDHKFIVQEMLFYTFWGIFHLPKTIKTLETKQSVKSIQRYRVILKDTEFQILHWKTDPLNMMVGGLKYKITAGISKESFWICLHLFNGQIQISTTKRDWFKMQKRTFACWILEYKNTWKSIRNSPNLTFNLRKLRWEFKEGF